MATDEQITSVRREARLQQYEYFSNMSGTKLELMRDQPPITLLGITKNGALMTSGYTFDGYRTITLTTAAAVTDTYQVDIGIVVNNTDVGDIIDYSSEEIYSVLRLYWTSTVLAQSTYVAELTNHLAAGYLIMKYWEGHPSGNDFWKHGRNLVDEAHKRITELTDGGRQLLIGAYDSTQRASKEYLAVQYKVLNQAPGLMPSGLYTQQAEDNDLEEY